MYYVVLHVEKTLLRKSVIVISAERTRHTLDYGHRRYGGALLLIAGGREQA